MTEIDRGATTNATRVCLLFNEHVDLLKDFVEKQKANLYVPSFFVCSDWKVPEGYALTLATADHTALKVEGPYKRSDKRSDDRDPKELTDCFNFLTRTVAFDAAPQAATLNFFDKVSPSDLRAHVRVELDNLSKYAIRACADPQFSQVTN